MGLAFIVVSSNVEEKFNTRLKPRRQVEVLSLQKAQAVAKQKKDALIIAADTLVAFGNEVIGKPKDEKDAQRILRKLSGTTHVALTGFTLLDTETKKIITKSVATSVRFRKLQDKEIRNFVRKEKPYDKAGAYAAHELAVIFIEKIEGDFFAIIGLPA